MTSLRSYVDASQTISTLKPLFNYNKSSPTLYITQWHGVDDNFR